MTCQANLSAHTTSYNPAFQTKLNGIARAFEHAGATSADAAKQATAAMYRTLVQQATQLAYLECGGEIDRLIDSASFSAEAAALARIGLASYFAGALVLPYRPFLAAAQELRHDIGLLAKRFGVTAAEGLIPPHPTLGDVDSPQALADYQAAKRIHKAEWTELRTGAGAG